MPEQGDGAMLKGVNKRVVEVVVGIPVAIKVSNAHKSLAGTLGIPELMPPEWRQTFKVREESL